MLAPFGIQLQDVRINSIRTLSEDIGKEKQFKRHICRGDSPIQYN